MGNGSGIPENLVRRTGWPESVSRAVGTPLQPSVVYASADPDQLDAQYDGRLSGYTYAREGHPNADVLARKIDALEGAPAPGGLILGSGMAAVSAVPLGLLKAGDRVLGGNQLYGRSLRLMAQDLPRFGIAADLADPTDADAMRAAIRPETRLILRRGRIEPDPADRRHGGDPGDRPRGGDSGRGRQHLHHAARLPALRPRRRYRHPFGDEAAGRPFRRDARLCRRARSRTPAGDPRFRRHRPG